MFFKNTLKSATSVYSISWRFNINKNLAKNFDSKGKNYKF